jgi:molybdenum cofactor synthesis domain-containing protein
MERLRKIGFSILTGVEVALQHLLSISKEIDSEEIALQDALNRILAQDIVSVINVPPFDRSAMDGYALKAENTFGASPKSPKSVDLIGTVEIGETSNLEVQKGKAVKISTGAPIPLGADSVIKIEETELNQGKVILYNAITPGKNVSTKGEDIKSGSLVLKKGLDLKAEHIALLSSLGINHLNVKKMPRVSIFATGNELIEPGFPLGKSKIYNSNTPMLSALVKLYGAMVIKEKTIRDEKAVIKEQLIEVLKDSDMVLVTGGTSVGTKDFLPEIIQEEGDVIDHGLAMRPGSPILTGIVRDKIVICLPGTPVAAYVGFIKLVGPTLRKMMGCMNLDPRIRLRARIEKDVPLSGLGYLHFLRVRLEEKEGEFIANPVKLKGSAIVSSLTQSDGIIEIPPNNEGLKKGENVIVYLFPK